MMQASAQPTVHFGVALGAGLIGTVTMTIAMALMHRRLPPEERAPLPPRDIAMQTAKRVSVLEDMNRRQRFGLTMTLHLAYGAGVGAFYPSFARLLPGPYPLKAMGFGLLVWTGSYLGWVPLTGLLPAATRHPAARNVLMIAAHLVWGAVIATIIEHVDGAKNHDTTAIRVDHRRPALPVR